MVFGSNSFSPCTINGCVVCLTEKQKIRRFLTILAQPLSPKTKRKVARSIPQIQQKIAETKEILDLTQLGIPLSFF